MKKREWEGLTVFLKPAQPMEVELRFEPGLNRTSTLTLICYPSMDQHLAYGGYRFGPSGMWKALNPTKDWKYFLQSQWFFTRLRSFLDRLASLQIRNGGLQPMVIYLVNRYVFELLKCAKHWLQEERTQTGSLRAGSMYSRDGRIPRHPSSAGCNLQNLISV